MTNTHKIIRHKRSARPTNPPDAIAAQAAPTPVESQIPASPESVILTLR